MANAPKAHRIEPIRVTLSREDAETLLATADYYQKSQGFFRHVVRLTSAAPTRRRFQFVQEETKVLTAFAQSTREKFSGDESREVTFTPLALVAFQGRLLSSIRSKRSHRKLASDEAEHRRHMAATFSATLRRYRERHPEIVADAIASRKRTEQAWINAEMGSATEDGPESQASP